MSYKKEFNKYLIELGKKNSTYGGGSALCLVFCMGLSLLEKALVFSFEDKKRISLLKKLRKKFLCLVDEDGRLFISALRARGKRKIFLINKIQKNIINLGISCYNIIIDFRNIEKNIKDSIKSDFYIGLDFLKLVIKGCIENLEANSKIFKIRRSKYIDIFKNYGKDIVCQ